MGFEPRHEEDYHSIKDDVPLYETVFMRVHVLMNQPQPVFSTQETHRPPPKAVRSPTVSVASPQGKKTKQKEKDGDNYKDRIEHGSHKENPKIVDDDNDKGEEKVEEKKGDDLGSLEIRTEETQITIPTPPSSPRKILSSDKKIDQELMDNVSNLTTTTLKHSHFKIQISSRYSHLSGALHRMCRRQGYMIQDMERKCVATDKLWETHNKIDKILHEFLKRNFQASKSPKANEEMRIFCEWKTNSADDEAFVIINP
ncbi:hypothetical protein Tco_1210593 [Tanacetum coccineum]